MEWSIVIGMCCTLLGAALSYAAFARGKSKDDRHAGQQSGVILTEVGYIKSSVDSINRKLDKQDERNLEFTTDLASVKASVKQAHHRIDRIEGTER